MCDNVYEQNDERHQSSDLFYIPELWFQTYLKIADCYEEEDLHLRCQKLLKVYVNTKNVCGLYAFAVQVNASVSSFI